MKKHSLTIIWAIIISGTSFLIANKFINTDTPGTENAIIKNIVQETQEIETVVKTSSTPQETVTLKNEKTFAENLKEGDSLFLNYYYKSAINEYTQAISKNPNSTEALKRLAEAYIKDNEPALAEETFKKALQITPDSNEIKLGIARSLLNQNETEKAKTIIWELPTEFTPARYYQAISLVLYEKYDEANKIFEELNNTENVSAKIKSNSEIFISAKEKIDLYAKDDVLFAKLIYLYALSLSEEYNSAIPQLFALINEKTNYRDAWIVLGFSYLNAGKYNEAIDALIKARDLDSEKPETMFYLGIAYFANNELEKSIYYLQKAQTLKFKPSDLLELKLAEVYNARNDFKKAEEKYESLLNNGMKEIAIFENLINLNLDKLNNPKKAFEIALKLYELYPNDIKTQILLSKIYIQTNNIKYAKTYLNNALTMDQSNAEIYYYMGKVSEAENKQLMAKEYYNTAYILGYYTDIAKKSADRLNIINSNLLNKTYQVNLLQQ